MAHLETFWRSEKYFTESKETEHNGQYYFRTHFDKSVWKWYIFAMKRYCFCDRETREFKNSFFYFTNPEAWSVVKMLGTALGKLFYDPNEPIGDEPVTPDPRPDEFGNYSQFWLQDSPYVSSEGNYTLRFNDSAAAVDNYEYTYILTVPFEEYPDIRESYEFKFNFSDLKDFERCLCNGLFKIDGLKTCYWRHSSFHKDCQFRMESSNLKICATVEEKQDVVRAFIMSSTNVFNGLFEKEKVDYFAIPGPEIDQVKQFFSETYNQFVTTPEKTFGDIPFRNLTPYMQDNYPDIHFDDPNFAVPFPPYRRPCNDWKTLAVRAFTALSIRLEECTKEHSSNTLCARLVYRLYNEWGDGLSLCMTDACALYQVLENSEKIYKKHNLFVCDDGNVPEPVDDNLLNEAIALFQL